MIDRHLLVVEKKIEATEEYEKSILPLRFNDLFWILFHHAMCVIGAPIALWPRLINVTDLVPFAWMGIVAAAPVLAMVCYMHALKNIMLKNLRAFERDVIGVKELCTLGEAAVKAQSEFLRIFGVNALIMMAQMLASTLFGSYFGIQHYFEMLDDQVEVIDGNEEHCLGVEDEDNEDKKCLLYNPRHAMLGCFLLLLVGVKYLHHVGTNVYRLQKAASQTRNALIKEKCLTNDLTVKKRIRLTLQELTSTSWALEIHGYLTIDRTTVPSVMAHLFALVILLVEFKRDNSKSKS